MRNKAQKIDVAKYQNQWPLGDKVKRAVGGVVWLLFYRCSPRVCFAWRAWLVRLFGADIGKGVNIYPSAKIRAPWNLTMGDFSSLGFEVDCYCVDKIRIGAHATISQYAFLCSASHDISHPSMKLMTKPISIGEGAWVAAGAFIAPGVTIGEGAVVGAKAAVFKNVKPWTVVGGNPAKFIKKRVIRGGL
jgi:putative colanic acid biosynthesis acetyltransferase WcaF